MCRVKVETPINLTKDQKVVLKVFSDSLSKSDKEHNPQEHGWVKGVKGFFEDMTTKFKQ
jgi:molecular chaperone DnaJ